MGENIVFLKIDKKHRVNAYIVSCTCTYHGGNGHEKILHREPKRDEGDEVILLIRAVHREAEHDRQEVHPEKNLEIIVNTLQ